MTYRQRGAFTAGLLLGGSLGVIRLAGAQTIGDLLLTGALTGAETAVVFFLEKKAKERDAQTAEIRTQGEKFGEAERTAEADKSEAARRQSLLDETHKAIKKIDDDFERDHEMGDLKTLTAIATNAMRGGCARALAENAGYLGGVRDKKDKNDENKGDK